MEFQNKLLLACGSAEYGTAGLVKLFLLVGLQDAELLKGTEIMDFQEANIKVEIVDSMQPDLQSATVSSGNLEKELRRLAELTEKEEHPSVFHYFRHGAIQRKLGKLRSDVDDLEEI